MADEIKNAHSMPAVPERGVIIYPRERPEDHARGNDGANVIDSHALMVFGDRTAQDYIDILKRRKNLALAVFGAIFTVVALYTFLVTPAYQSTAVLLIQDKTTRDVDPKNRADSEAAFQRYIETEVGTLRSRSLAEQLVTKMNLTDSSELQSWRGRWLGWIRKQLSSLIPSSDPNRVELDRIRRENEAVEAIERRLFVRQVSKSQLMQVGMEASSPGFAQSMLKTYLDLYLGAKLNIERGASVEALHWLKDELEKAQIAILESESALVKFIAEHGIVPSEDGGLAEVVDMIKKKREGVIKAQELEAKLQGLKGGGGAARYSLRTDVTEDEMLKKLKESLATLETEYTQASGAYSPDSPRAILLKRRIRELEQRVATVQNQSIGAALKAAQKEAEVLTTGVARAKEEALRIGSLGAQYAILKKDVDTNKELHRILLKDYKETLIKSRTSQAAITIIDPPILPMAPVWPRKGLFLVLGTILGAFGGVLVVFAAHFMDEAREGAGQVEREFNMTRLGTVPDASKLKQLHTVDRSRYEFLSYERPNSPVADSIRSIHASILFSAAGGEDVRSVLVSSATAGEGKTFIAVSLATALTCNNSQLTCSSSKRIIVVDCDMRQPNIHRVFRTYSNGAGLATLLTSRSATLDTVIRDNHIPGLFYMTAGPPVDDPSTLLMSDRFAEIVDELRSRFDCVIFDSPPILGFPEIRILCPYSDGVLLVVEEGRTNQSELRAAISVVSSTRNGKILGFVLNKARPYRSQFMYAGHYYYGRTRPSTGP